MGKIPVQTPLGARPGLGSQPRYEASRWPLGRICKNAVINIGWVRLTQSWPWVIQIAGKNKKNQKETIKHNIAWCPNLSASIYLHLRHNKVTNVIYHNIAPKGEEKCREPIPELYSDEHTEIWWDTKIKTLTPVQHKPDIVMWKKEDK